MNTAVISNPTQRLFLALAVFAFVLSFALLPLRFAHAATTLDNGSTSDTGLTAAEAQSIIVLLQSFNVDPTTLAQVEVALGVSNTSNTPSATIDTSSLTAAAGASFTLTGTAIGVQSVQIILTDRNGHSYFNSSTLPVTNGRWQVIDSAGLSAGTYGIEIFGYSDAAGIQPVTNAGESGALTGAYNLTVVTAQIPETPTITAAPNPCIIQPGATTCTTSLTWSTTDASACVYYSADSSGNPGRWCTPTSAAGYNPHYISTTPVTFTLRSYDSPTAPALGSVTVIGAAATCSSTSSNGCATPTTYTGTIKATPNPCAIVSGSTTCGTSIVWSTNDPNACVYYSADASGNPGWWCGVMDDTANPFYPTWITKGGVTFTLYQSQSLSSPVLASVHAEGVSTGAFTGTITASPNPCTIQPGATTCTTSLSWSTSDANACVYYSADKYGNPGRWCTPTSAAGYNPHYITTTPVTFTLRSYDSPTAPALGSVTVTGVPATSGSDGTPPSDSGGAAVILSPFSLLANVIAAPLNWYIDQLSNSLYNLGLY